jgi:hypothetical protein
LINTLKQNDMGHIKEPKGVDFIINSGPLSKQQEANISAYIREYKAKSKKTSKKKPGAKVHSTA